MALIEKLTNIADAIREKTNNTKEMSLEQMADAIHNIETINNLQDKSVTITENGTQTIVADEGYEGLSSVEVNSEVVGTGLDFSSIYGTEQAQDFNSFYLENANKEIVFAKEIKDYIESKNLTNWNGLCWTTFPNPQFMPSVNIKPTTINRTWVNCSKMDKFPLLDLSSVTDFTCAWDGASKIKRFPKMDFSKGIYFTQTWKGCTNLVELPFDELPNATSCELMFQDCVNLVAEYFNIKPTNMNSCFVRCSKLPNIYTDCSNNTNFGNTFYGCTSVSKLHIKSIAKSTGFGNTFFDLVSLTELLAEDWKSHSINLQWSSKLIPSSIHYIIQNAMSVADGAIARTLTLHATAKANWEASEYYEQDLAVLEEKGITIA